jgi:hypothetical protein
MFYKTLNYKDMKLIKKNCGVVKTSWKHNADCFFHNLALK